MDRFREPNEPHWNSYTTSHHTTSRQRQPQHNSRRDLDKALSHKHTNSYSLQHVKHTETPGLEQRHRTSPNNPLGKHSATGGSITVPWSARISRPSSHRPVKTSPQPFTNHLRNRSIAPSCGIRVARQQSGSQDRQWAYATSSHDSSTGPVFSDIPSDVYSSLCDSRSESMSVSRAKQVHCMLLSASLLDIQGCRC